MGTRNGKPFFRADQVGSLLRPERLLTARDRFDRGDIDRDALWAAENDAIEEAVRLQEAAGFDIVTDGEFRRSVWWYDFVNALDGIEITEPDRRSGFSGVGAGEWEYFPKTVRTVGPLGRSQDIAAPEYAALAAMTDRTAKITIPSPSRLHFHGGRAAVDPAVYPEMAAFWADVVRVYREEIAALEAAGCRYIQMDDPILTYFLDDRLRENVRGIGEDPDTLIDTYVDVLNDCVSERRPDTAVGIHLCRGNSRSTWVADGPYDRIAETVFGRLDIDLFFLEYDDPRSGGFEPLRHLPRGKVAVLGLITTKRPELEDPDAVKRRIDDAARFVDPDDIALSPQCGFASNVEGNLVTVEDEKRKLALVVDIAQSVWGSA